MKLDRYKIYSAIITLVLILALFWISKAVPQEIWQEFVRSSGPLGPLTLILLLTLADVVAPLSATPIIFVGFHIYGSLAIIYDIIANAIAIIINFIIARYLGRPIVTMFVGTENLDKIDHLTHHYGLGLLLLLRVFQPGLGDFVSYGAGLTKMRFWKYLTVSLLGMIPGTAIWYWLSLQTDSALVFTAITWGLTIILSGIFVVIVFITKRIKKRYGKWHPREERSSSGDSSPS